MATVNVYYRWDVPIDGESKSGGSLSLPVTVTAAGGVKHDATYTVASAAADPPAVGDVKVLLNVGATATDDIAAPASPALSLVIITSTKTGYVELTGTAAADNSTIPILANVPLFLGGLTGNVLTGGTKTYNAAGGFAGTTCNITKISFFQKSGANATVRVVALA